VRELGSGGGRMSRRAAARTWIEGRIQGGPGGPLRRLIRGGWRTEYGASRRRKGAPRVKGQGAIT